MKFIIPTVLIGISVGIFFLFTNPIYNDITEKRAEAVFYNEALDNSKALENERDKLTAKYNSIDPDNLIKIQKLLPDNIDNIRLIIEIGQIALPYGMMLKDVKYNATPEKDTGGSTTGTVVQGGGMTGQVNKDYGVWDLEFSTTGTYANFIRFMKELESNLRIVDISSIQFSSGSSDGRLTPGINPSSETYTYTFKIKTYWLKN